MSDTAGAVQQVVQALNVLYTDPNPAAKEKANAWLSDFQKSEAAWSTAQLILFAPDAPVEPKLFAAQTFRTKISYDLAQLPSAHLLPLRDSLLTALRSFASGPRVILTQLCIALADLALQLTSAEWADPPTSMVEMFGKEPAMAGALLEFLQVLAEEYSGNLKLDVKSDFGRPEEGKAGQQAAQVIGLLSMYVQAPGVTPALQNQCFATLGAWMKTGQATASNVSGTPLLDSLFTALASDELFDAAVDALVNLIHETQELQDNMAVIQDLVPRLIALRPALLSEDVREDEDKMRGYCRILVEAGEWYEPLVVPHLDSFLPLVEAIAICASCDHLEVVGITSNFWYRLTHGVRKSRGDPKIQPLLDVYAGLIGTIIKHLHYPDDSAALAGQERDDFRTFRHDIGDTLKDCCAVLGATACLRRSYDIISETLAKGAGGAAVRWQDVEAPLFSMRSMGAEVDPSENEVMPLIMDLMPKLPSHPKIRYAATLVIGRYTQWINLHPDHIQFTLPYVSSGLEDSDVEVSAAAAQTMKYLCKDCSYHLIPYLSQLHTFVQSVSAKLSPEDLLDISAAIAHIIAAMPPSEAPQALSLFCMPLVEIVHNVTVKEGVASRDDLRLATDALERLDMFLAIVDRLPNGLPPSCAGTCEQGWAVLDAFLVKYGSNLQAGVAEKTCVAVRRGLQFFEEEAFKVAPSVLARMASSFEVQPASSYLWITAKMVAFFSRRGDPTFDEALKSAFERESNKLFGLLQSMPPSQVADVLDDYVHLVADIVEYAPALLFLSPSFPGAFQTALSTATLLSPAVALAALDAIRAVIGHESLHQAAGGQVYGVPFPPTFAPAITAVIDSVAFQLVSILVEGLVDGMEDVSSNALTLLRVMAAQFPSQLAASVPNAIEALEVRFASAAEKTEFMTRFSNAGNPNQVKDAFTWLLRTSRKSRERARVLEDRR
ncbi:mRNA transport regulator (Mtr10) [Pseudohyphozyma bogoriensis]|nr:mRNA transport regulator (Mtr10) [Pseudohyphozyma bogoriensis]